MKNNFNWTAGYTVNGTIVTIWVLKFPGTDHVISKAEYIAEFKGWKVTHMGGLGQQQIVAGLLDFKIVHEKANKFLQECIIGLRNAFIPSHKPFANGE